MVIQVISSNMIGTLTNEQQGFVFSVPKNDENGELQISGRGYSTETVVSEIESIRLGEHKAISSVACSISAYHPNQPFVLSCEPEILEIQRQGDEYIVKPTTIGRTELCISIEGFEPIRQGITIKSPPLPGVPAFWDASSPYVLLPQELVPSPEDAKAELAQSNGKLMNKCTIVGHTPSVRLMKNDVHVHTMEVRYRSSALFDQDLEISCFHAEPAIELPIPSTHQHLLSWFDASGTRMNQHTTSTCGETFYTLRGKDAKEEWSDIIDRSGELIRCRVSTSNWDFNEIIGRDVSVVQVEKMNQIVMQVCLPRPDEYPEQLLEDLEHSLSPAGSFEIESSPDGLSFFISPKTSGNYSTNLVLSSATYNARSEVTVNFDEALDFSERTMSEVEIRAFVAQNHLVAIEYSTPFAEFEKLEQFELQLHLHDEYLMYLRPNKSNLLFPIHSRPTMGHFRLVAPWHPYFSPLEIEPRIETVELAYSAEEFTLERPELVSWEPTLYMRMKQRAEGLRPPSTDSINHKISRVGKEVELDGIRSENFYPVIIAYPYNHPPEVFVMFDIQSHDFIGDDGILAMFEDDEAPLILGEGDWTDGRDIFHQNGKAVFELPGVYILGLCLPFVREGMAIKSGENWCGKDENVWGFRYTVFTEIEVI